MKATYACCLLLLGCDLPELSEAQGQGGDASPGGADAAPTADTPDAHPPAPQPDAAPPLGACDPSSWVASASSADGNDLPSQAIDGNPATRWTTGAPQAPGQYFQLDFGAVVTVSGLSLEHRFGSDGLTDYPRGLDVLASTDGVAFAQTLASVTESTDPGGPVAVSFGAQPTRYLRLQLTAGAAMPWWSIHELAVTCAGE